MYAVGTVKHAKGMYAVGTVKHAKGMYAVGTVKYAVRGCMLLELLSML